ncbi:hypothetical protein K9L63_02210 [Candidatus Gracilibacteria bacterium]|nr:hypothetical protein [Candidatus Gracilibacteria bacterium]
MHDSPTRAGHQHVSENIANFLLQGGWRWWITPFVLMALVCSSFIDIPLSVVIGMQR